MRQFSGCINVTTKDTKDTKAAENDETIYTILFVSFVFFVVKKKVTGYGGDLL
jgi:hypothetical protein